MLYRCAHSFFILFFLFIGVKPVSSTVLVEGQYLLSQGNWSELHPKESIRLERLLQILSNSSHARDLIQRALAKNTDLSSFISVSSSSGSYTESLLIRKLVGGIAGGRQQLVLEEQRKIFLGKERTVMEAALDLVHELTHYLNRPLTSPYEEKFNFPNFMELYIEGPGGEVEAYLNECYVINDIFKSSSSLEKYPHCKAKADIRSMVKEFYKLGPSYSVFAEEITQIDGQKLKIENFPMISPAGPSFVSAMESLPYPLALLHQYQRLTKNVCVNDEARIIQLKKENLSRYEGDELSFTEKRYFAHCLDHF